MALRWLTTGSTRDLERDHCAEVFCFFPLGFAEEIVVLEPLPVFRFVSEVASQFQAVLRGEQAAAGEDVVEYLRADVDFCSEICLRLSASRQVFLCNVSSRNPLKKYRRLIASTSLERGKVSPSGMR